MAGSTSSTRAGVTEGTDLVAKYDRLAARFTAHEYGDPRRYFEHRADIAVSLGPRIVRGDRVVDLACADGSFAAPLVALGLVYRGVDLSERMVDVARARGVRAEPGNLLSYHPDAPVAATTLFRSFHFVDDRVAFFRHVAEFTEKKLVFDFNPRADPPDLLQEELVRAGRTQLDLHPFFVPQHRALPSPLAALLCAAERNGPLARAVLRVRFKLIAAASR